MIGFHVNVVIIIREKGSLSVRAKKPDRKIIGLAGAISFPSKMK
jgi:hypothetical protein